MNEKKYLIDNKTLMKEWNYEKNSNLAPSDFMSSSNEKVWWKCDKGHEWEAVIYSRTAGNNCPYCSGKKRLEGYNDIFTLHPSWKKYWDIETNNSNDINPYLLGDKSHRKVSWICSKCGKKFIRALYKTKDIVLCIECTNENNGLNRVRTIIKNKGSLLENHPDIAKEWNYEKNGDLKPENVSANSNKKVWWICSKGHEWESIITSRTSANNRKCPYCVNQKILKGYNDLESLYPDIATEWNYEKNNLKPYEVGAGSGKKYWWLCKQGHEYQMSPLNRVYGMGCPICSSERKISIPEKTVLYYLKKFLQEEIISNYRSDTIRNKELDIFFPNRNVGIEYDGIFFHKNKKRDIEKDLLCKKIGITVLHIAESKMGNQVKDNYIYYDFTKQTSLEWAINILLNKLLNTNKNYDIDVKRDRIEIYNLIDYYEKEQSLLNNYPDIAKEWNYEKNGKLKPEFVPYGSEKKVWWRCPKGHEYESVIHSRTAGTGCPYCAGQKVLKGFNDLATFYPLVAKEWNYEKNGKLNPNEITLGSNRKIWWKCTKGHEWQTTVHQRTISGQNCPYCAGQKAIIGKNDLLTVNPELAKEWNYERNGDLKPENFMPNSHKKIWWKCDNGHEWEAVIGDRHNGNDCPYCSNFKLLKGYNDLATKNPNLVKEWNYKKNENLKPSDFFPNTNKKVWWICLKGHEYEAKISDRNRGNGCPICSGKQIVKGYNDLATFCPELNKYWNYEKNENLTPNKIGIKSGKKVWWKCPDCDCEWQLRVADMTKKKYKCSKCKKEN